MPDRYAVPFQAFITNGAVITSDVTGRVATAGNTTLTLSTTGGAGTFTITLGSGCTGTITSGTATITDSPKALVAGANTITSNGAGNCTLNLTLGTAANWNTVNTWSASTGGVSGASVPTSADNVYFNANSFTAASQILTVDATANCLNMDWTGSLNTPTLRIETAVWLYAYGNMTFISDMVCNANSYGFICFKGGISPQNTLTTGGLAFGSGVGVVVGDGAAGAGLGNMKLADNLSVSTGDFRLQGGTFDSTSKSITCQRWLDSGAVANKTLTLGTSTITVGSQGWLMTGGALTITDSTHTINLSGAAPFTGSAVVSGSYGTVNLSGTAHTISGSNTFVNLTRNGTATKTDTLTLTADTTQTVTGTCALIGNSAVNRLLVQSSTLGTAATINNDGNWTGTNGFDSMDITYTHAVDFSAGGLNPAAYAGDCGGNTGLTATASDAQTSASTASWATVAGWTGTVISRVPLPQDDVTCSHSKTVDMPRIGRSISFSGTPALTYSVNNSLYGSLTCAAGQTGTWLSSTSQLISLRGRTALLTLTAAGQSFYKITMFAPSGTYTLQDALTVTNIFALTNGTWVDNGQTLTLSATTAISKWTANGGSITSTGTIVLTNSGATGNTFAGNGLTYNNVTVTGASNYALTISGNNTFNTFTVDRSVAAKTLTLTAGSNQQIADFVCATSGTTTLTIGSTSTTVSTLTKTGGGTETVDYLNISYVTGAPANTWYFGANCNSGRKVAGWIFTAAILIGEVVVATRAAPFSRAAPLIVGIVVNAVRTAAFARTATALSIGIVTVATRAVTFARTAANIIGEVVTATYTFAEGILKVVLGSPAQQLTITSTIQRK